MPVVVAPSTQTIPPGTPGPENIVAQVVLNTGDALTFGFASAVRDAGVTRATFDLRLEMVGSGSLLINRDTNYNETNVAVVYTASAPIGVQLTLQGGGEPKGSSHGTAFGYHAETHLLRLRHPTEAAD
jgi:hypothetical protein